MQYVLAAAGTAASNSDGSVSDGLGVALVIAAALAALAVAVLVVAAIVSVLKHDVLAAGGKAVWILLIFAFPVLGAVIWFVWGRSGQFTKSL